jgi:hypothetical protein
MRVVKAACSSDTLDLNQVRCSQADEVIARNLRPRFPQEAGHDFAFFAKTLPLSSHLSGCAIGLDFRT